MAKIRNGFDDVKGNKRLNAKVLNVFSPIFAQILFSMEVKHKSRGMYWLLFFISTAALIAAIAFNWEWLTLIIPFVTTFFVLAMDII